MTYENRPLFRWLALIPLSVACGGGGKPGAPKPEPEPETGPDSLVDRYSSLETASEHCDGSGEELDGGAVTALQEDELLLLDAAPQCDVGRFGQNDGRPGARTIVSRSAIEGEGSFALCSCTVLEASNRVMAPGNSEITGDVGANERIFSSAPFAVDGIVISGGDARFDNTLEAAEVRIAESVTASNEVTVSGDATLGGLDVPGNRVSVGGTLTVPEGTDVSSVESVGELVEDNIDVPPPCDCSQHTDYDGLRERFRDVDGDGDDDYADYDYGELADEDGAYIYPAPPGLLNGLVDEHTVYLSCGSYYFDDIQSDDALTIVAVGHVDVYVDGNVEVAGPLTITARDDSSLDLYVAGEFTPDNTVDLGNPSEPDAFRLYVQGKFRTAGPLVFSGTLFAPSADVITDNTFENRGAVFANSLDFAAPITVLDGPRFTGDACLLWDEADSDLIDQGD